MRKLLWWIGYHLLSIQHILEPSPAARNHIHRAMMRHDERKP